MKAFVIHAAITFTVATTAYACSGVDASTGATDGGASSGQSVMHVTKKYHTNVTPKGNEPADLYCVETRSQVNDEFARDCGAPTDCWTRANNDDPDTPCTEMWIDKYNSLSIGDTF
jgi:hypothetical protein